MTPGPQPPRHGDAGWADGAAAQPDRPPRAADPDAVDSSGRPLAMSLPDWDLLPPAELLDRRKRE